MIQRWYRKNYLIDPKVQLKIVSLLAGVALIAAVVICVVAYERLIKLGILFNSSYVPPAVLPQAFKELAASLMFRLCLVVVLMVVVFGAVGVVLTHQVAGPIWKLQNELKKFLNGEPIPPLKFRQHDAFKDLPEYINKLIEGYKR